MDAIYDSAQLPAGHTAGMDMPSSAHPLPSTDESPHPESSLEWWFAHGTFAGEGIKPRSFMLSLFRHATGADAAPGSDGVSLLLAVLEEGSASHRCLSRIDQRLLDWTVTDGKAVFEASNVDPALVQALLRELKAHGPLRPIECDPRPASFSSHPLKASWGACELKQEADGFLLSFLEPETNIPCRLTLGPLPPRCDVMGESRNPALAAMEYFSYPRIPLQGTFGEHSVQGTAWLDHQWGSLGWLLAPGEKKRVLGWDWFGLNLDDGSDWIIMVHRDAQSGAALIAHASVWDSVGRCRRTHDITLSVLRHWTSPRSKIKHPVAWRIEIPELAATFLFEPTADDQEIPLFGTTRAIWEGAGTVSGSVAGRGCSGQARGEFQGYGHIFEFETQLETLAQEIDGELEAFLPREMDLATLESFVGKSHWQHAPEALTATLTTPVWDLMGRKGKRWRPAFGLLMLEVLGETAERYRTMLCILAELAHTGSLIVDDIEDNSKVRRGGPSIHERYGLDVALNAGNALYFLPNLLVKNHPDLSDKQRLEIYEIINRVFIQAHCGQGLDIYWSSHMNPDNLERWLDASLAPKILQGYGYKTAAPIAGFAEIAAVVASADPAVRAAAADLGRVFGVAFQVLDDVRNFSTSAHWTKIAGEDLTQGKLTYVIVRTMDRLEPESRHKLIRLLCSPELRQSQEAIEEALQLVHRSGALRLCKDEARGWLRASWAQFAKQVPPSEAKLLLELLCERMLELPYDP